jgi:hypothetical protein
MDQHDRDLILGLANRLRQAPPVAQDPQAAELIAQQIASQPNAVYLLVQAVLLQEEALKQAQARTAAAPQPTFTPNPGYNPAFAPQPGYNPAFGQPAYNPAFGQQAGYGQNPAYGQQPQQGGGFLKTAAAAAAGVAGGALLVAGVSELFSDDQASHAQEAQGEDEGFGFTDLF